MSRADRFLKACHKQETDCTPIWLMRQAGRYMQEYRDLRKKYDILELIKSPELACEVTMQPVNAFDVDAAIIFADILPLLEGMGLELEFIKGEGPIFHNPIKTTADIQALGTPEVRESLDYTIKACEVTVKELDGLIPLIGFSGAPFTLASYAIEGKSSKTYLKTKQLMYTDRKNWHLLMDKLSNQIAEYMIAQAEAGVKALQLFDSWIGALSPYDYREYVQDHVKHIINRVKDRYPELPFIYFGTGVGGFFELYADCGSDIIGVDWRMDLLDAWQKIDFEKGVQGNLDPVLLLGSDEELKKQASRLLDSVSGRNGHIMNLGHGIHKETDPGKVKLLVDFVHEHSKK